MSLSASERRELKAHAQTLKPLVRIGDPGLSPELVLQIQTMLKDHPLLKVKLGGHQDERKSMAQQLAEKVEAELVAVIGHVIILYKDPEPEDDSADSEDQNEDSDS